MLGKLGRIKQAEGYINELLQIKPEPPKRPKECIRLLFVLDKHERLFICLWQQPVDAPLDGPIGSAIRANDVVRASEKINYPVSVSGLIEMNHFSKF